MGITRFGYRDLIPSNLQLSPDHGQRMVFLGYASAKSFHVEDIYVSDAEQTAGTVTSLDRMKVMAAVRTSWWKMSWKTAAERLPECVSTLSTVMRYQPSAKWPDNLVLSRRGAGSLVNAFMHPRLFARISILSC